MKKKIYLFLTISFILMTLLSCQRKNVVALVNEKELFSLKYGSFEDELNLFNLSGTGAINTYMTMLDGFFYIANGELKKIMELNSYGDLLSLYYNEEITKTPSFTNKDTENSTKKAIIVQHFPLIEPFKSKSHEITNQQEYLKGFLTGGLF